MVFQGKIDAKSKVFARFLREESGITVKEITKRCNVSRASVYRCLQNEKIWSKKKSTGRPRRITLREQRIIRRNIVKLRESEGNFSINTIRAESGLSNVPLCTVNRALKRMKFQFCDARRKGVLTKADRSTRVKFAREVVKSNCPNLWKEDICFYLDGVSFWYKTNPVLQRRKPRVTRFGDDATRDWIRDAQLLHKTVQKHEKLLSVYELSYFIY